MIRGVLIGLILVAAAASSPAAAQDGRKAFTGDTVFPLRAVMPADQRAIVERVWRGRDELRAAPNDLVGREAVTKLTADTKAALGLAGAGASGKTVTWVGVVKGIGAATPGGAWVDIEIGEDLYLGTLAPDETILTRAVIPPSSPAYATLRTMKEDARIRFTATPIELFAGARHYPKLARIAARIVSIELIP